MNQSKYFLLTLLLSLVTLVAFSSVACAMDNPPSKNPKNEIPVKISSYDWNGKIPESRLVVVKNLYGSIRSRNQIGEEIFLHATIQEIGDDPLKAKFNIEERSGKLYIEVNYAESIKDSQGKLRGRADLSVLFPDDVSVYAETDFGLIKIDKTASHVQAKSQSGAIKLSTTGLFAAISESGTIDLKLRGSKMAGKSEATTESGKIKVELFDDMELRLLASSKGKVSMGKQKEKKQLSYEFGQSAVLVDLKSQTGDIQINRIKPPALEKSVKPSNVTSIDVDLRNLPKSKLWKPGDPIIERDDKRNNSSRAKN